MHILLTDITTCPRCGPAFGLVLLVDEVRERRVSRGWLACPNCRERYPIRAGVADLRQGAEAEWGAAPAEAAVQRLVALAGVTTGPGYLLVAGPGAAHAAAIAGWVPDVELVTVVAEPASDGDRHNRLASVEALPFRSEVMAGVVLTGGAADALLEEGARVLMLIGRLVLQPVPERAAERLAAAGLRVLAEDGATLVAARR